MSLVTLTPQVRAFWRHKCKYPRVHQRASLDSSFLFCPFSLSLPCRFKLSVDDQCDKSDPEEIYRSRSLGQNLEIQKSLTPESSFVNLWLINLEVGLTSTFGGCWWSVCVPLFAAEGLMGLTTGWCPEAAEDGMACILSPFYTPEY